MAMVKNFLTILSAPVIAFLAILLRSRLSTTWRWAEVITADVVVVDATIYTSDPVLPFAEAMAIRNGRILRVGNYSDIKDLIGEVTCILNFEGKVVVPGFIDSHVHFLYGGLRMGHVELRGVKSQDEFIEKVKEAMRGKLPGEWVLGSGWNNDIWGGDLPIASWIDDVTPNNPVWLSRVDGHMGLANTLAMNIAGISKYTHDPVGGTISKTMDGEPTGLFADSAMKLLLDVIPEASVDDRRDALIRASKYALMRGVTMVVDVGRYFPGETVDHVWKDLSDVYRWADLAGRMLIRVCLFFPLQTWSSLAALIQENGRALSEWLYLGGVKAFFDGSLGSKSALFYEPYEDDPDNYGIQVTDFDWLLNMTLACDKSSLQVAIHAIGDKANDLVLDLYHSVASSNGIRDRRFRIEHAQHLVPATTTRFGQQRVIASVQPDHLLDDAGSAEQKIGAIRAHTGSYLFQSLLSGGARIAFGSDWPIADINPLKSIKTALTRRLPNWNTAWISSEIIALDDALNAYTISAAHAIFLDHEVGSLSPGKYADFVVFPSTSWEEFADDVPATVFATYINGVQAYP
ncbi:protein LONG AFTER FAR-RED 3 [Dioscorea cayenensis subsp. rotundata]|uniref:Protein LONG AFTER FAR-RED 3 n=1 Tax=Dioscorea cayennensis subsp. rotundata TaxID=55577 RepID=A0AB40C843_DIOCR|nr:protein LONG AFTER FAR-RED 3 [Dioscorea cayenensis subsp. rotundata]